MDGHTLYRVTVNLVDAPLGSEVWVPDDADWLPPYVAGGILVPLTGPQGAAGGDAPHQAGETTSVQGEEHSEPPTAAQGVAPGAGEADVTPGSQQLD